MGSMTTKWQYGELKVNYPPDGTATGTWGDGTNAESFDGLLYLAKLNELGHEGWELVSTSADRWTVNLTPPPDTMYGPSPVQPPLEFRSLTYTLKRSYIA